ncbi:superoxide dismutase, Fe-Mn family [Halobacillus alkaliphilus]|uniref:superoxide dismutase n=1 Tax=Halobacillus alkaliphilus TaxID=396056 RepID=A0A1I2PJ93_9BACI|nr:superoxide dismutase [Halobacillus alkaliphilus]SFG15503.1 superoxide dismutase, Fe-Mn family [Halobacillus alkaliphilus]
MNDQSLVNYLREMETWANHIAKADASRPFSEDPSFQEEMNELLSQIKEWNRDASSFNLENAHELNKLAEKIQQRFGEDERQGDSVPIGGHQLPPLPYDYAALEPYIDRRIMQLHHDKHHQSYVDGLNKAEREMQKARRNKDYDLIKHWEREAAFNGAGHYLHTIFWEIMSPRGGGKPGGELLKEIENSFGSFQKFKEHYSAAAKKVEGSGWTILVWSPRSHRLEILQAEKHQNLSQWDVIPLLPIDVWEHAYYLQYENDRGKYVDNWWNVVNWDAVQDRYKKARQVKWAKF